MPILQAIISRNLAGGGCSRLLAGDGIATLDFTVKALPGLYAGLSLDARDAKKANPVMGSVMSTAKNLDEYYFKICSLVSSLPDSAVKLNLQKFRIGIVASFAKLSEMVGAANYAGLSEWDRQAKIMLDASIEAFLAASNPNLKPRIKCSGSMDYFGVPEKSAESALREFYGID